MKVLIVDDSADVVQSLQDLLSQIPGVEIIESAANVPEAVVAIERSKPQLVISDIRMPGGSGLDVLRTAKSLEPAPVVAMFTSFPYLQYRERCLRGGADFFLDKSKEFATVAEICSTLIAGNSPTPSCE